MIIFLRKIMTGYTNLDTLRKKVFLIDKSVIDKSLICQLKILFFSDIVKYNTL